ncbi:MAG: 3-phosphoshikimate 1-carboxyvinyltransferase [Ilumatobacteraceae bacterium]
MVGSLHVTQQRINGPIVVNVPGSKSVANRALVCAALAEGDSRISGLPDGDDTSVIISALTEVHRIVRDGDAYVVRGGVTPMLPGIVDARLAGTSSRFLTAVAALINSTTVIDGGEPLRARPMGDLHDALISLGADVEWLGERGHLPVAVSRGSLAGGNISIRGDVSSQFISALMLIAPLLKGGLTIQIVGELVSRSYVEMTAAVMSSFGATVSVGSNRVVVSEGQYRSTDYRVEPDFSSAAFPLVAPILTPCSVRVTGLAKGVLQGDAALLDILRSVGCAVSVVGDDVVVESNESTTFTPLNVVMTDCSDLVPAVAVALSGINGESNISGVGFIRNKESNRLGDLAAEMSSCGAVVSVTDDGLTISGHTPVPACSVNTHHDHRLAMALSLYALRNGGVTINEADVVSKSWPSYFEDMKAILSVEGA